MFLRLTKESLFMSEIIVPSSVPKDLAEFEIASCDLAYEYWSPQEIGEVKRMVFKCIQTRTVPDHNNDDADVELPCAVFLIPGKTVDEIKTIVNGSKRLVAVFENNQIGEGTPVQVTYKGKKKNRTNGNMSDDWSVVTLVAKAKQ